MQHKILMLSPLSPLSFAFSAFSPRHEGHSAAVYSSAERFCAQKNKQRTKMKIN